MQPEIVFGYWYVADTSEGIYYYPMNDVSLADIIDMWRDGKLLSTKTREGYGARLSMPGYMDATEWSVFDTEDQARSYLIDMYDADPNDF